MGPEPTDDAAEQPQERERPQAGESRAVAFGVPRPFPFQSDGRSAQRADQQDRQWLGSHIDSAVAFTPNDQRARLSHRAPSCRASRSFARHLSIAAYFTIVMRLVA
jgi:hypothetical protein